MFLAPPKFQTPTVDPALVAQIRAAQRPGQAIQGRPIRPFTDHFKGFLTGMYTDMYQVAMGQGYKASGRLTDNASFNQFIRKGPYKGRFQVFAGTNYIADFLSNYNFPLESVLALAKINGNDGKPIFDPEYLALLSAMQFACHVDIVPEGTVVFPHTPGAQVFGPLFQGQLVETAILNFANFQSLIATKASRVVLAAAGDPVVGFGFRRAQGLASIEATLAEYIGGTVGTSHLAAYQMYGVPPGGTQAHSYIMSYKEELEAFRQFALSQPNNTVLLVDTYDSIEGIKKAIQVGKMLESMGHKLNGIRLDSGDLAALSIEARKLLNAAGLNYVKIYASNDLDEYRITELKALGAKIDVWGIGTRLITGGEQAANGGVYKVSYVQIDGKWYARMKLSEDEIKKSIPGFTRFKRLIGPDGMFYGDLIYDASKPFVMPTEMFDPWNQMTIPIPANIQAEEVLVPAFRNGKLVYRHDTPQEARKRAQEQLRRVPAGVRRLQNPDYYPVGLTPDLHRMREDLARQLSSQP